MFKTRYKNDCYACAYVSTHRSKKHAVSWLCPMYSSGNSYPNRYKSRPVRCCVQLWSAQNPESAPFVNPLSIQPTAGTNDWHCPTSPPSRKAQVNMAANLVAFQLFVSLNEVKDSKEKILSLLSSLKRCHKDVSCDYIESLSAITSFLLNEMPEDETHKPTTNASINCNADILSTILRDSCIPTLHKCSINLTEQSAKEKSKIFQLTCALVSKIVCMGELENGVMVWNIVLHSFKCFVNDHGLDGSTDQSNGYLSVCINASNFTIFEIVQWQMCTHQTLC